MARGVEELPSPVAIATFAGELRKLGAATCAVGGSILFLIRGDERRWLVELDEPSGRWTRLDAGGPIPAANVTIDATPRALWAMLMAPQELRQLREQGELVVSGERSRLAALAEAIARGGKALQLRAAAARAPVAPPPQAAAPIWFPRQPSPIAAKWISS